MTLEQIKERLKSEEYNFLKKNGKLGSNVILLALGGSYAYGMEKEGSDLDVSRSIICICQILEKKSLRTEKCFFPKSAYIHLPDMLAASSADWKIKQPGS